MKRTLSMVFMSLLVLTLTGCGSKEPAAKKANGESVSPVPEQSQATGEHQKPQNETATGSKTLPPSYPIETLPLAVDAVIIDIKENPASKGLEIMYVSDNNIDTICDFYEGALKDAKDLNTIETPDGYWITARMNGVDYTIMLDKNAMNPNPLYAGKVSVYIVLSGLEGVSGNTQTPEGEGKAWPFEELPGVPQLEGHIETILREDGIIRLEIIVDNAEKVKSYIGELAAAGFSFDTEPDVDSDHMEFLAFKGSSMISFAFKGEENAVSIDYQK